MPADMGWGETLRIFRVLRSDPSSAIAAALEGWDYATSREALLLADLYDLTVAANTTEKGRPDPHPMRPYKNERREKKRYGNAGGRSRAEVVAILNAHGHTLSA